MNEFVYNKNVELRDNMLFNGYNPKAYRGGLRSFERLSYRELKWLVDNHFANPEDSQNWAPSIANFLKFMENHKGFYVGGYAISPDREDYRVSIDSIGCDDDILEDKEALVDFVEMFRFADDFSIVDGGANAWFD